MQSSDQLYNDAQNSFKVYIYFQNSIKECICLDDRTKMRVIDLIMMKKDFLYEAQKKIINIIFIP